MKVLILEDHRVPIVSMELGISGAGGIYEPKDLPGLATMTAQMLREGTSTRSNQEILEQVARLGATLSSRSNFGSAQASVSASGLARNMDEWVEIVLDVLLQPSFPESELDRLREQAKVGLRQQRSSPAFLADERFNAAVFGDHPAGIVTETEASLDAMSSETIARWHRDRYTPQNSILGIAGDVDPDELIPQLNEWFAAWERTDLVEELPPDPTPPSETRIVLVDRPNSEQTTIYIGTLAIDRRHPDYVPFTVMNEVLGGGSAARLFINLREEKGYTYGAYSTFSALKYPGAWRAFGDVRTEVTEGAMNEFMNEITRIREEPVPEGELAETKRSIVAGFALSLEQPSSLLGYSTLRAIYGFDADYWDVYPSQIMAVTSEDVQSMAEKYLGPDRLQIVAVGDAGRIREFMEQFGTVELYDPGREPGRPAVSHPLVRTAVAFLMRDVGPPAIIHRATPPDSRCGRGGLVPHTPVRKALPAGWRRRLPRHRSFGRGRRTVLQDLGRVESSSR